jgi:transcriptional regulator with XRE-family HTH domain
MAQGMSQAELGRKVGVTFQQIQKYEMGTNRIGSSRLKKFANVFGIEISALFGEEGSGGAPRCAARCPTA